MKIKFLSLISIFICVSSVMTSCLKDDDNSIVYPTDATIYSFSINDIKTTIIRNKDTVSFTVDSKDYPFSIDQKAGLIFNSDSLPVRTDVSKVSLNITTAGGPVYYQKNGKDTIWTSADSLDFSNSSSVKPVIFTVYSPDLQSATRQYKVWINVHKQYPDSLQWDPVRSSDFPGASITGKQKAVLLDNTLYVFAQVGQGVKVTSTSVRDGRDWEPLADLNGIASTADYASVIAFDHKLFITAGGKAYTSVDGTNWELTPSPEIRTFVSSFTNNPVSSTRLYPQDKRLIGISGENFIQTSDGASWNLSGPVPGNFPVDHFAATPAYISNSNPDVERVSVIGTVAGIDTAAVSWTILSNERSYIQLSPSYDSADNCPKLENLSLIRYDDLLYAFGGKGIYNPSIEAFEAFYVSEDNGIYWKKVTGNLSFPIQFLGREESFSYVVDQDNFIWIMWSGSTEVWKGRINRLGFIK